MLFDNAIKIKTNLIIDYDNNKNKIKTLKRLTQRIEIRSYILAAKKIYQNKVEYIKIFTRHYENI